MIHVPDDADDTPDDDDADHDEANQERAASCRTAVGGMLWVLTHIYASMST